MTIRSGRFTGKIKKNDELILINSGHAPNSETIYRFFNSGSEEFYVEVESPPVTFVVKPKDSVDVFIKTSAVIKTSSTTLVEIEGIYDCLLGLTKVRSGRFNMTAPNTNSLKIVGNKGKPDDVIYRFFNSGEKNFQVNTDTQTGVDLKAGNSFDIAVKANATITAAAANDKLEGIYELLGGNNPVRSGRFKSTANHTTELKIIETSKGTAKKKWYRLYNSAPAGSVIEVSESVGGAMVAEIGSGQTRDLSVGKGALYVRAATPVPPTPPTPIEGIYEFLGTVE